MKYTIEEFQDGYDSYDLITFIVVDLETIKLVRDFRHVICIVSPNNALYAVRRRGQSLFLSAGSSIVAAAAARTWTCDNDAIDIYFWGKWDE